MLGYQRSIPNLSDLKLVSLVLDYEYLGIDI